MKSLIQNSNILWNIRCNKFNWGRFCMTHYKIYKYYMYCYQLHILGFGHNSNLGIVKHKSLLTDNIQYHSLIGISNTEYCYKFNIQSNISHRAVNIDRYSSLWHSLRHKYFIFENRRVQLPRYSLYKQSHLYRSNMDLHKHYIY